MGTERVFYRRRARDLFLKSWWVRCGDETYGPILREQSALVLLAFYEREA